MAKIKKKQAAEASRLKAAALQYITATKPADNGCVVSSSLSDVSSALLSMIMLRVSTVSF